MTKKRVILVIMDGWGLGKVASSDAILNANVPFTRSLYLQYPNTTLITCGEAVGLPEGQMGNSEVGHLNLGAGRVVYQELQRINVAIREGDFFNNEKLLNALHFAKNNHKPLHLLGLVSNGGVHSHINHLKAILDLCEREQLSQVYIHAFTDGRDCDPKSGLGFIKELQAHCNETTGQIASISGRYYAMDRDKRWERIKLAYDVMVNGIGDRSNDPIKTIENSYLQNITDEFIKPTVITNSFDQPIATIKDGDVAICFNFRTDRCREITQVLTQIDLPDPVAESFGMRKLNLHYTTMTEYDQSYQNIQVMYDNDNLNNTLGEVMQQQGLTQVRMAETEKYPHVSFFFSGGREIPFMGERRIMIPSPKVATYDMQPEMSAYELTDALLTEINQQSADFICVNYANTDMVGHTGVWSAAIKAAETVDKCVEKVVTAALANGYSIFLTADHGNSDYMINADGSPNTAHTLNPVPFFIIDPTWRGMIKPGKLADIAPTILTFMGIALPAEMSGEVLIDKP